MTSRLDFNAETHLMVWLTGTFWVHFPIFHLHPHSPLFMPSSNTRLVPSFKRPLHIHACHFFQSGCHIPPDFVPDWVKAARNGAGTGGIAVGHFDTLETAQVPSAASRIAFRAETTIGQLSVARSTLGSMTRVH